MKELSNLIGAATQYFQRGNLPQAELICRYINRLYGEHPAVYVLLGKIALATGLYDFAETYLRRAAEVEPGDREARESLAIARARKEQDVGTNGIASAPTPGPWQRGQPAVQTQRLAEAGPLNMVGEGTVSRIRPAFPSLLFVEA